MNNAEIHDLDKNKHYGDGPIEITMEEAAGCNNVVIKTTIWNHCTLYKLAYLDFKKLEHVFPFVKAVGSSKDATSKLQGL